LLIFSACFIRQLLSESLVIVFLIFWYNSHFG
jgi:hypothetical protein